MPRKDNALSRHPYNTMGLRVGMEVLVRAKIVGLSPKNTLGWAHGFVNVQLSTGSGLAGGGFGVVTVRDIVVEKEKRRAK